MKRVCLIHVFFFYLCKGDRVDELESLHEIRGAV
jgi:hypothetical protein